jgi:hypothetical protein
VIINLICILISWLVLQRPPFAPLKDFIFIYFLVGLSMAVNGLLLVYASLPSRTPGTLTFIFSLSKT